MFDAGTRTSSKNTSLKWCRSAMFTSGRTVIPGVFMSIRKNEIPRCFGASGSVRAKQKIQSACCAPDVQIFCPFTMKSSPSRTARVCSDAKSEPEPGSLNPWHHEISALRIAGRKKPLLLRRPVHDDRRPHPVHALVVRRRPVVRHRLVEQRLPHRPSPRPAVLLRPAQRQPAALRQRPGGTLA